MRQRVMPFDMTRFFLFDKHGALFYNETYIKHRKRKYEKNRMYVVVLPHAFLRGLQFSAAGFRYFPDEQYGSF